MTTPPWLFKFAINYPVILIAVVWQYIIMAALLWNASAINATSLHILTSVMQAKGVWYVMLISSTLAVFALASRRLLDTVIFLLPQQALLYLSAAASLQAIWLGHFADGVIRAQAFILADQSLPLLLAVAHTWTLVIIWWRAGDGRSSRMDELLREAGLVAHAAGKEEGRQERRSDDVSSLVRAQAQLEERRKDKS